MAIFKSFGENPSGEHLERIKKSGNFRNGVFQNISPTEMMVKRTSMLSMTWKFFNKPRSTAPPGVLPSVKTDIIRLQHPKPVIIWFGHSSYLIKAGGKNVLVDPVMSGHASPFTFGAKSFPGSDVFTPDDLPVIDLLLITHDHYDHLDHQTVKQLLPKVKQVCTSLGVGAHLVYWGFDRNKITELDWNDSMTFFDSLKLTAAPARHFSGRSLNRNKTLWASYILDADGHKFYIGADSGYDSHFRKIGEEQGGFDIALLETGQYNSNWPYIHMKPEEAVQAAVDLRARVMMPVHWGKFALAFHDWDDPVKRVTARAPALNIEVTTPLIGEPVIIGTSYPSSRWWETL